MYKNTSVLVTGGCGFIGSHLVDTLIKLGARVVVIDKDKFCPYRNKRAEYIFTDLLINSYDISEYRFDYVFHLAAKCDLNGKKIEDYAVNFIGTKLLLNKLNSTKLKKFVFYSTQLVIGLFNETRFIDSNEPYKTSTLYGRSKIKGEKIVKTLCARQKIPYSIIRPTSVYGPRGKEPYRDFFLSIKRGHYVHVGKASNLVSLAYVKNLIDLTLIVGSKDDSAGNIYYGTDFHPYTMREIVETCSDHFKNNIITVPEWVIWIAAYFFGLLRYFGFNTPIYPFRLKNILCNYCYDIQNLVKLGYDPMFDLRGGIRETLDWYKKFDKDFK